MLRPSVWATQTGLEPEISEIFRTEMVSDAEPDLINHR
jgi:hypothetical protein